MGEGENIYYSGHPQNDKECILINVLWESDKFLESCLLIGDVVINQMMNRERLQE